MILLSIFPLQQWFPVFIYTLVNIGEREIFLNGWVLAPNISSCNFSVYFKKKLHTCIRVRWILQLLHLHTLGNDGAPAQEKGFILSTLETLEHVRDLQTFSKLLPLVIQSLCGSQVRACCYQMHLDMCVQSCLVVLSIAMCDKVPENCLGKLGLLFQNSDYFTDF